MYIKFEDTGFGYENIYTPEGHTMHSTVARCQHTRLLLLLRSVGGCRGKNEVLQAAIPARSE